MSPPAQAIGRSGATLNRRSWHGLAMDAQVGFRRYEYVKPKYDSLVLLADVTRSLRGCLRHLRRRNRAKCVVSYRWLFGDAAALPGNFPTLTNSDKAVRMLDRTTYAARF